MALEQEQVGPPAQNAFRGEVKEARRCAPAVMQAATVWRIDAYGAASASESRVGAPLGAVTVHDIRANLLRALSDMADGCDVAATELPRHRDACETECEIARQFGKRRIRLGATAASVRDDTDPVAARGLSARQI